VGGLNLLVLVFGEGVVVALALFSQHDQIAAVMANDSEACSSRCSASLV